MNLEVVKDYYGKVLKSSKDLKTSACCDGNAYRRSSEALLPMCMRRCVPNIMAAASSSRRRFAARACSISARARGATSI